MKTTPNFWMVLKILFYVYKYDKFKDQLLSSDKKFIN